MGFSSTTPTGACNTCRSSIPSSWLRQGSSRRSECWRFIRQRARRNDQRPLQGRGYPSTRTMAQLRSRGVRHDRMGRLVQPPASSGAHREQFLPPRPNNATTPCWTHQKWPHNLNQTVPGNPEEIQNLLMIVFDKHGYAWYSGSKMTLGTFGRRDPCENLISLTKIILKQALDLLHMKEKNLG